MLRRKWGTVRANEQLVRASGELLRVHNDPNTSAFLETLTAGPSTNLPPGHRSLVRGYGEADPDFYVITGLWPGISGGVLTVNDTPSGHQFVVTSGVLTLDDGASVADAAIATPNNVLMVSDI